MPTTVTAATSSKGEPMDFIMLGNNLSVQLYWLPTNSTVVVPELPEEPNKPVLPNTVSASVPTKNFVSEETTETKTSSTLNSNRTCRCL